MSLSERLRPDVEAAPWVIEEVKKLEAENERIRELVRQILIAEGWCPRTKPVPPPGRILKEHEYE